ncbi:hypothetical protein [Hoeflea sp.]|uniref:hypothetical protein n=1 Tax=Hoeflea sp. TaxID=1940281 RepID=UPI0019A4F140|nr:hypothetical protein [Hoeflea sp.]MBC7283039.1 hypothetical protein [Hoeflea sp.]
MGATGIKLDEGGASSGFHAPGIPNQFNKVCPLMARIPNVEVPNIAKNTRWEFGVAYRHGKSAGITLACVFDAVSRMSPNPGKPGRMLEQYSFSDRRWRAMRRIQR